MLDQCPDRVESPPEAHGVYKYFTRSTPTRPLPCYLRRQSSGPEEVLLDLNNLDKEGSLGQMKISRSQRFLAYTLETEPGSETYIAYVDDLHAGTTVDIIPDVHGIEFAGDDKSILYTASHSTAAGRPSKVMLREMGHQMVKDTCIMEELDEQFYVHVGRTKDYRYLTISANSKTSSEVHILDANNPWHHSKTCIQPRSHGCEYFVEHHRGHLYILTNQGEGEYCVMSTQVQQLDRRHWRMLVPVRQGRCIEDMDVFDSALILYERCNGWPAMSLLSLQKGTLASPQLKDITLPEGTAELIPGANPDFHAKELMVRMSSPVKPEATWCLELQEPFTLSVFSSAGVASQPECPAAVHEGGRTPTNVHVASDFISNRMEVRCADGTVIPLTLSHKKGLELDGSHPALLHAYGAYGMCLDAGFKPERLSLLRRGWVVALAHVRGGGELGRQWHQAATGTGKHRSVDDLEACMDFLIRRGYSRKGRVALEGASAGGLLAAALLNRRPGCIGAAVLRVPFVDVLTTMLDPTLPLTVHEYDEFGNPSEDVEAFESLQKLCPYANLRPAEYPPVLVTCALNDQRVPAWGPAKKLSISASTGSSAASGDRRVQELRLDQIRRPLQGTRTNDPKKVKQLVDSIAEIGLQEPIDVLEVEGKYYGFSGCHRYEAHQQLGKETILCKVRRASKTTLKMHMM
ncbi:g8019 [Coccomyxa elongata]